MKDPDRRIPGSLFVGKPDDAARWIEGQVGNKARRSLCKTFLKADLARPQRSLAPHREAHYRDTGTIDPGIDSQQFKCTVGVGHGARGMQGLGPTTGLRESSSAETIDDEGSDTQSLERGGPSDLGAGNTGAAVQEDHRGSRIGTFRQI